MSFSFKSQCYTNSLSTAYFPAECLMQKNHKRPGAETQQCAKKLKSSTHLVYFGPTHWQCSVPHTLSNLISPNVNEVLWSVIKANLSLSWIKPKPTLITLIGNMFCTGEVHNMVWIIKKWQRKTMWTEAERKEKRVCTANNNNKKLDLQSRQSRVLLKQQLRKLLQLITVQPPAAGKTYDQPVSLYVCVCVCVHLHVCLRVCRLWIISASCLRIGLATGYCVSVCPECHINIHLKVQAN